MEFQICRLRSLNLILTRISFGRLASGRFDLRSCTSPFLLILSFIFSAFPSLLITGLTSRSDYLKLYLFRSGFRTESAWCHSLSMAIILKSLLVFALFSLLVHVLAEPYCDPIYGLPSYVNCHNLLYDYPAIAHLDTRDHGFILPLFPKPTWWTSWQWENRRYLPETWANSKTRPDLSIYPIPSVPPLIYPLANLHRWLYDHVGICSPRRWHDEYRYRYME